MIPWKLWTSLPSLELWQAVALLVDIDPDSLTHHPNAWMAGPGRGPVLESRSFPSAAKREAFDKALLFAKRAATYGGPIALPRGYPPSAAGTADVALREVAAFFLGCDWPDIPAPMLALLTVEDSPQAALPTETELAPAAGAAARADEPAGIVSGWTPERRKTLLTKFRDLDGKRPAENGKKGKHGALAELVRKSGVDKDTLGLQLDRAIKEKADAGRWAQLNTAK